MSDPSEYSVQFKASCTCDWCISVLFPWSFCMESHASFTMPVVTTPRLATSVQLSVIWPLTSWSRNIHSLMVGILEYIGVIVNWIMLDGVSVIGIDLGSGFCIYTLIIPLMQVVEKYSFSIVVSFLHWISVLWRVLWVKLFLTLLCCRTWYELYFVNFPCRLFDFMCKWGP